MTDLQKELIKACKEGNMYDFIASNAYQYDKSELVEILKQTLYAVYQRLGDQSKEVEQKIPSNLMDYDFFGEDLTADEKAYIEYLSGNCSYTSYLTVCEQEEVTPEPAK
jgi:hypothetical protein